MPLELLDDEQGRQYKVETGFGHIAKVDNTGSRNVRVEVRADHLRENVGGWVDTHDRALFDLVIRARTDGHRIRYRVETHRKPDAPPEPALAALERRDKVRVLAELELVDSEGVGLEPAVAAAQVRRDEAPAPANGAAAAPGDRSRQGSARPVPSATPATDAPPAEPEGRQLDTSPTGPPRSAELADAPWCAVCGAPIVRQPSERAQGGRRKHLNRPADCQAATVDHGLRQQTAREHDLAVDDPAVDELLGLGPIATLDPRQERQEPAEEAARRPGPPVPEGPPDGHQRPPIAPAVFRGRREEAKPWQRHNTDQTVNLGSYAAGAVIGFVEWAAELLVREARVKWELTGGTIEPPREAQVRALARNLLECADAAQAAVRVDGLYDRMDASHTRARGAVRAAVDLYPVPFGADETARAEWRYAVIAHATMLLKVAKGLLEAEDEAGAR